MEQVNCSLQVCLRVTNQSSSSVQKNLTSNKACGQKLFRSLQHTSTKIEYPTISSGYYFISACEKQSSNDEYRCPSRLTQKIAEMVILDKHVNKYDYHLPLSSPIISIIDPKHSNITSDIQEPISSEVPNAKEAKEIMRIRHKKMKKHKLKKLRKRMYFVWKKQKMVRRAKRDAIYWKEIADIKKDGDDFDAEKFVTEQLNKARRGGYYVNVFESKN